MESPIAQGQENGAGIAVNTPQAETPPEGTGTQEQVPSGIQKRFDELTAKIHDNERLVAQYQQMSAQLAASLTAAQQQLVDRERPPEPQVEFDADELKKFEMYTKRTFGPQLLRIEQALSGIRGQVGVGNEVERAAALVGRPDLVPQVAAYVEQTIKAGNPANPKDVLAWRIGQELIEQKARAFQAEQERIRANGGVPTLPGHAAPQNLSTGTELPAYPKDFDRWDPGKQADWIEKYRRPWETAAELQ